MKNILTYQKKKIKIYSSEIGYAIISKIYKQYHQELDNWDKQKYQFFLPRDLTGMSVLDLGGGDGRLYKHLMNKKIGKYVLGDISQAMLDKCKYKIEKQICNCETTLPFNDEEFDIVLAFFVCLHVSNLDNMFREVHRILKPQGRFIVLHHNERRNMIYQNGKEEFKILTHNHRFADLEKIAFHNLFQIEKFDLEEKNTNIGKIFCFIK